MIMFINFPCLVPVIHGCLRTSVMYLGCSLIQMKQSDILSSLLWGLVVFLIVRVCSSNCRVLYISRNHYDEAILKTTFFYYFILVIDGKLVIGTLGESA